jgi:hypothetical protein
MRDISENFTKKQNNSDGLPLHAVNTGKQYVNFSIGNLTFSVSKTKKHNRPLWVAVQGLIRPTPYTYIHPRPKLSTKYFSIFSFKEANGHT